MHPTLSFWARLGTAPLLALTISAACTQSSGDEDVGEDEAAQTRWSAPAEGSCEAKGMLRVANTASARELDVDAKLDGRVAANVVAARPFATLRALDDVPRLGPAALSAIMAYARARGELDACRTNPPAQELGVVSDLDKTVIPEAEPDLSEKPYPGVKALLTLLEHRNNGAAGDIYYVTARTPEKIAEVPDYLARFGVPPGKYETGVSGVPWVAQAEKVRDIKAIFARTGTQRFVLLGDSSHRDPEVYKEILAAHPERVIAAFIHKVNTTVAPARVQGLYLHESYAEVAATLYKLEVITRAEAKAVMTSAKDEGLAISASEIDAMLSSPPR
jgi:hypothetical protein